MVICKEKLKKALAAKGMHKSELCLAVGVSSRTIAKIAKGEELRAEVVDRIAHALGVHSEDLKQENVILSTLDRERRAKLFGGLYHETQIRLTYNSNHIEGSRLTEDQTRYIFETKTVGSLPADIPMDDLLETNNHFRALDLIIENANAPLSEAFILDLHRLLKQGTNFAALYGAGKYKSLPNTVGGMETTAPDEVPRAMAYLLSRYGAIKKPTFEDIVDFHYRFECIHPFQDGNGRIGRLLLFKESLKNGLIPVYIDDRYKQQYYNGLREWRAEPGFLLETCRFGQDLYKRLLDYFKVPYTE